MVDVILTHEHADFDAIASMLAAWKLYPDAIPVLPRSQSRIVKDFLALYRNGLPFIKWWDAKFRKIDRIILTDTQTVPTIRGAKKTTPVLILEHHPQERDFASHETFMGDEVGAVTTMLVEQMQQRHITLNTLEATVLALGIYSDTGLLTYVGTTPRDIRAAAWLQEQGAVLDTVRKFISRPMSDEQQTLFEDLLPTIETRNIQGYDISMAAIEIDYYVQGINVVTMRLREMFESAAMIVIVKMERNLQLVFRSTDDAINVGELASTLGGGGHPRAAAAHREPEESISDLMQHIWHYLQKHIQPAVRVADLMSYGVQTVSASASIKAIIPRMRRIGHEGYPVLDEDNKLVGLLTLRDADRTLEHGLNKATVREVMHAGEIYLTPEDSVAQLEQHMVNSGWGQIPVMHAGDLIGIVTRTDLIKHWARTHPSVDVAQPPALSRHEALTVLGDATTRLIDTIAATAQEMGITMYLVGGVVRDLLLQRRNDDIDFVVESDAIHFADTLCNRYGGRIHAHKPFGTAKWLLDDAACAALGVAAADVPDTIDFATARNEFYMHPTALPTVYSGSIKLDLGRRDFTINTLAVQLSPVATQWRVLDYYGGLNDLQQRLIRVLHSLSFVDDPTRILRAVRFSERLHFTIEPRTAELITTSLPMLRRITGERLRNELSLLLQEDQRARGMLKLQALGALEAIHPAWRISPQLEDDFQRVQSDGDLWQQVEQANADAVDAYWHVVMAALPPDDVLALAERLLISKAQTQSLYDAAATLQQAAQLADPDIPRSTKAQWLANRTETALRVVAAMRTGSVRETLLQYLHHWRTVQPTVNGHTLRQMGLTPGPEYKIILEQLRKAWLDGNIQSEHEEQILLEQLVGEVYS